MCTNSQLFNLATLCMQYFNGLVAKFLMFAAMYKILKWVTFGSFLGQTDDAYLGQWVIRVTKCDPVATLVYRHRLQLFAL